MSTYIKINEQVKGPYQDYEIREKEDARAPCSGVGGMETRDAGARHNERHA